jgi:tRNA(fMet)-specific endonuclease VapC
MNLNGRYLLDTNIVIALFAGDKAVEAKVRNTADVALAPPIIGELYFGAQKSGKVTENLQRINMLIEEHILFSCDLETAQWYGIIKDRLRRKGTPIPNNDIWIAALAMQHDLTLVTRDSHFDEVESLQTERW